MAGMRPAWQSPAIPPRQQPPPPSLSSSHFPPPSSSLLPTPSASSSSANGHGHHAHHSNSIFSSSHVTGDDKLQSASTALDRVMGLLDGFEDDMDCPLCLEEMDISDLNFKPCPCGYQICRFCYNHIKEDLNNRCPACRATYDDTTVEFKAIKPDELKRLQAAKKLRDKRRKDEALTVKNMANVRVRQRAQVHIQGMTTKIANEDTLNQLKGGEQFGQYGKVVKLFMSKRSSTVTQPASTHPLYQPVNVYVNYRTPAEASACIAAIDGSTTEDGHKLKAIWGTTRYCPTYLKGGKCGNENCMQAHEPGEEIEGVGPASREEIYTYHAVSDSDLQRNKATNAAIIAKKPEATLPATASWASKNAAPLPPTPILPFNASLPPLTASIKTPPIHTARPPPSPATIPVSKPPTHPLPARPSSRATRSKEKEEAKLQAALERMAERERERDRLKEERLRAERGETEEVVEEVVEVLQEEEEEEEEDETPIASSSTPPSPRSVAVGVNGDLSSPPRSRSRSPQPQFPELEFGEGAFSFSLNLDVKGKGRASGAHSTVNLDGYRPDVDGAASLFPPPPSLPQQHGFGAPGAPPPSSSYFGSFDPFAESTSTSSSMGSFALPSPFGAVEEEEEVSPPSTAGAGEDMSRRSSRFGFARRGSSSVGQQGQGAGGAPTAALKNGEFAAAMSRLGFAVAGSGGSGNGRESPAPSHGSGGGGGGGATFAPPGIGMPHPHQHQQRPPSSTSIGYGSLPPLASPNGNGDHSNPLTRSSSLGDPSILWPGVNLSSTTNGAGGASTFPPGVLRSLAGQQQSPGGSANSSPQLSPRTIAARGPYGAGAGAGSPGPNGASASLPPGISLNRTPIPAASFPLPPPAPRPSGQTSSIVGKEDLLALIAKAQAAAPKQHQESHPFFSDPAILNARLASVSNGVSPSPSSASSQPLPPQQSLPHFYAQQQQQQGGAAHYSLDGQPPQQQQQQYRPQFDQQQFGAGAGYSLPPPPGVQRPASAQQQHFQQQQQQQQQQQRRG